MFGYVYLLTYRIEDRSYIHVKVKNSYGVSLTLL